MTSVKTNFSRTSISRKMAIGLFALAAFAFTPSNNSAFSQAIDPELLRGIGQNTDAIDRRPSRLDETRPSREEMDRARARQAARDVAEEISPLEEDYGSRYGQDEDMPDEEKLRQFGYDVFAQVSLDVDTSVGEMKSDYILGIGDELVVSFVGSNERSLVRSIDREGRLVLPEMQPIAAAGRRFADFVADLNARVKESMLGTDIYISLGQVRQAGVYVMGEVSLPGLYNMNSLSSVMQVLANAGGVKKSGSLRNIRVESGGNTQTVDLYDLMLSGRSADLKLMDGARVIVNPIGDTIAVVGRVSRPAIYELASGSSQINWDEARALAGGTIRPRGNNVTVSRFDDGGREYSTAIGADGEVVQSGDLIEVLFAQDVQLGRVELTGHVRVPGIRSLDAAPTLSALLGGADSLGETPYLPLAILETVDEHSKAKVFKGVNLISILAGAEDIRLRNDDHLMVLSMDDVRFASSEEVRNSILLGDGSNSACESVGYVARFANQQGKDRFRAVTGGVFVQVHKLLAAEEEKQKDEVTSSFRGASSDEQVRESGLEFSEDLGTEQAFGSEGLLDFSELEGALEEDCPSLFEESPALLAFALEHAAAVTGRVRVPGIFPVAGSANVSDLISYAGGFANDADLTGIELTSLDANGAVSRRQFDFSASAAEVVRSGDNMRIHQLENDMEEGTVLLGGEVVRPGVYSIVRGERLTSLISRAGGLTEFAYPYGAVFTREAARLQQQEALARAAREIDSALAVAAVRSDIEAGSLVAARDLARDLSSSEALGRVVTEADPVALRVRPELDTILEPGDSLHIPKRPNFVTLAGDVLNPGALQFVSGKTTEDYISEAGGIQRSADRKRAFLVYPNGSARQVKMSGWASDDLPVPPGSVIVVPKNLDPITKLDLVTSISGIVSQLALSAASIAVISR